MLIDRFPAFVVQIGRMALWRERLFAWMLKSSESAMEFFKLPTNRVVELGSQLHL